MPRGGTSKPGEPQRGAAAIAARMAADRERVQSAAWAAFDAGENPTAEQFAATVGLHRDTLRPHVAALRAAGLYPDFPPRARAPRDPSLPRTAPPSPPPTPAEIEERKLKIRRSW